MKFNNDFEQEFDREFPDDLKRDLGLIIRNGYVDAQRAITSSGISNPFDLHASPQIRHYLIQTRVVEQLKGYENITIHIDKHHSGNEPYAVIKSGKFCLTVSMVKHRGALPRRTPYRLANASLNNLFSNCKNPDDDDDRIYAILSHVPTSDNRHPKHIDLLFPDSRYGRAELRYDWMPIIEFQTGSIAVPSEEIVVPPLRFREDKKKKAEGA